jgi:hypothetical protein
MTGRFLRYRSTFWTVNYPIDWTVKEHKGGVSFFAEKGVGAFQITACLKDEKVTTDNLDESIKAEVPQNSELNTFELADFNGFAAEVKYVDHFWRMWFLMKDKLLLSVTYNCEFTDREVERGQVDEMVNSLKWQNQE